jgi:hypothetical protein
VPLLSTFPRPTIQWSCERSSRLSVAERALRGPPTHTAEGRDTKPLLVSVQFCAPLSVRAVTSQSDLNCLKNGQPPGEIFAESGLTRGLRSGTPATMWDLNLADGIGASRAPRARKRIAHRPFDFAQGKSSAVGADVKRNPSPSGTAETCTLRQPRESAAGHNILVFTISVTDRLFTI